MVRTYFTGRSGWYLLAFLLAFLSNYFFTGQWLTRFEDYDANLWSWRQSLATACLLAAIFISMTCFGSRSHFEDQETNTCSDKLPKWWSFLPCLLLYFFAGWLYFTKGETSTVRWLWLLSILTLFPPLFRSFDFRDFYRIHFWEYLVLIGLIGVGFTLRYTYLADLPFQSDNDVSIMGVYSRQLITDNDWSWVGMAPTNHQYSEHQFHSISMRLFGQNRYGIAMFSVLAGTATIILIHFAGRMLFNHWVGLIAATFLAFNYVHIHFSRIIFGPLTTFFLTIGSLFLLHGFKRASHGSFALGGIGLGLGLLGYYSGRIGPVLWGAAFLIWFFQRKKHPQIRLSHWLTALAGMLVTFGPNLIFTLKSFQTMHGRGNDVILWNANAWKHASFSYNGGFWTVMEEQVTRTLLAPFYYPDSGTICYLREPMLGVAAGIFFILGLGYCLRRYRDMPYLYPLLWIGLTFLCGGILTIDPPFWPHLNIAIPAMSLVAAIGAERLTRQCVSNLKPSLSAAGIILLISALLFSGIQNYIVYCAFAEKHITGRTLAMRRIQDLPLDYRIYLISNQIKWEHASFQFFTHPRDGSDISTDAFLSSPPAITRPTAFFVFHDAPQACLDFFTKNYPYAVRQHNTDGWGGNAFTLIHVFPDGYTQTAVDPSTASRWLLAGWYSIYVLVFFFIISAVLLYRRDYPKDKKT